ncbi:hypothetical protein DUPY_43890 [Duganella phyllosphaerae]|uniref:Uncharacterized protein n=1 Tax=Duganella phyllosphaerae TaxID=762836 RepID=A0A1E7WCP6_9BURK|nr:hypothetical protein DUPY_43890 [Duganella phyllosphaerae]
MVCAATLVTRSVLLMPLSLENATDSAVVALGTVAWIVVALLLTMTWPSLTPMASVVAPAWPGADWNTSACKAAWAAPGADDVRV